MNCLTKLDAELSLSRFSGAVYSAAGFAQLLGIDLRVAIFNADNQRARFVLDRQ
jgi:hypothetical protein